MSAQFSDVRLALATAAEPTSRKPAAPILLPEPDIREAGPVSIAVMNWVWANSPTSGNERLVLLALADACSRDDGTGCWPSAATIARKANISDRTVRRVITRLEADGHLIVHRGGGRAGSTNSYTVVTGDRVIHSPGQNVPPDTLSGGDTGDRPPLTELRQGSPDMAVSPDPPKNHQGTAAPPVRDARPAVGAATGSGGVGEFFATLGNAWRLTGAQRARLTPTVKAALDLGWTPQALASVTGANTTGVRNPYAVLATRLSLAELPPPTRLAGPLWCGECDQVTRMLDYHGDAPRPCPKCKAPRPGKPMWQSVPRPALSSIPSEAEPAVLHPKHDLR